MESAGSKNVIITIVMPVRNEGRFIRSVLEDLRAQDFPFQQMELLIIDGASTDNTVAEASAFKDDFPNFQIIENPGRLASRARNIGARTATGKYIAFIDGHCHLPSRTLVSDMVELFERSGADALCRPQPLTLKPQTLFQRAVSLARASGLGHALNSTIYTHRERFVNAASSGAIYRREVFQTIGYFDETFDACEDVEFNTRLDKSGMKAFISPKLTVEYAARKNITSLFVQLYRYGVGRWKLFRKHPSTLGSGTLITTVFTGFAVVYPLLWLWSQKLAIAASIVAAIYLAAVFVTSLVIVRKPAEKILFIYLPFIFFTIHFALGYGFLVGIIRHRS
ncbi:MAG: glycosyltransferase [Candidatus Zixiibacteriota bacterium]